MVKQHALFVDLDITGTKTAQRNPQMKNRKDRERQKRISSCAKLAEKCPYSAIVDTGCTSSVVGEKWMKRYIAGLDSLTRSLD